jgi:two-component system, chemotaxis family, CheB/CheR fusion protein
MTKRTSRKSRSKRPERSKKTTALSKLKAMEHVGRRFPIVGLGASAGGLEALEQFLNHVPSKSGLAFVIIQHLDPTRKGMLVELLQRATAMPVVQIKDRMRVAPDHVYVIPPNNDLSILHGALHLTEPAEKRGLRLPINFFFLSLAADQKEQSVGVILSGMGSDGTDGLGAIKEVAGAVFVQTPSTAKFDSMPRMAVEAGLADVVAPADELPGKIIAYLKHIPRLSPPDKDMGDKDQNALEKIIILLRNKTGHDFTLYKKSTICRRIERRRGLHQIAATPDYLRYLKENPQESDLLFKELLIGVTSFFRDAPVWEQMKNQVVRELFASRPKGGLVRAWVAGCSTGEEAYSLAIVLKEAMGRAKSPKTFSFQIFATDLDKDAIDKARSGVYPESIKANVSAERLRRFFIKNEHAGFTVKQEIREMVTFAPQNIVMHPPFTKLDLVTCRNLLIYFDPELQKKLIPLFHYSLNPKGVLLLGSSETVGTATNLFAPLPGNSRLYRKLESFPKSLGVDFPSAFTLHSPEAASSTSRAGKQGTPEANLQSFADQMLLQKYSPAAVLVTKDGDILYVSGRTGKFLEPAAGKANWNIFAMARGGLRDALNEAFHKAIRQKIVITLEGVSINGAGESQIVSVTIDPVNLPEEFQGTAMVVFQEVTPSTAPSASKSSKRAEPDGRRLTDLMKELHETRQHLRAERDERQTSQEELKSTNEELQSTNEELQSTNEELTTSKEEMQSMNEELQTVNHELQSKVDELSHTSNDMKNLLDSTDIATLFLDDALLVRRFTPRISGVIKLIPSDIGRPITDIVRTLDYPELAADAHKVLKSLVPIEKEVPAREGLRFKVRTMPYRTHENVIDGIVITFTDTTTAKNLEAKLRKAQAAVEIRLSRRTDQLGKAEKKLRGEKARRGKAAS